ncbi:MAG TPA: hypothetical protein VMA72_16085 [Streptosporangiaceae bacterium]|nr:hypothetical protein [Streptosporangiaceae bacterium]
MMRTIKMLAAILASLTALAAPAVLMSPAANASSTAKTVVYGFGAGCPALQHVSWAHPKVKPGQAHFGLSCEVGIHRIRWRDWRRESAFGHGSYLQFNGIGFNNRPATIALSRVRLHKKHRYFSHLIIVWKGRNSKHHRLVMNWRYNKTERLWGWN